MLGPVWEGGATGALVRLCGPVSQLTLIAICFLPDATSEKRHKRKQQQEPVCYILGCFDRCFKGFSPHFFSVLLSFSLRDNGTMLF